MSLIKNILLSILFFLNLTCHNATNRRNTEKKVFQLVLAHISAKHPKNIKLEDDSELRVNIQSSQSNLIYVMSKMDDAFWNMDINLDSKPDILYSVKVNEDQKYLKTEFFVFLNNGSRYTLSTTFDSN